jgi:hypothetical protein
VEPVLLSECDRLGGQHRESGRKVRWQTGTVRTHPGRERLSGGRLDEARDAVPPSLSQADQLDMPAGEVREQIEGRIQQRQAQRGRHRVGEAFAAVQVGAAPQVGRDRMSEQRAYVHSPPHGRLRQDLARRGGVRRQQE